MYNFDKLLNRKGTDSTKWDALIRDYGNPDLIPLWVADMDFEPLPQLNEELRNRTINSTYGYTFAGEGYYESIIGWNSRRHGFEIAREEIINVPGVVCALSFVISALTEKGDKILINTPVYPPFFDVIEKSDRKLICSPLVASDSGYTINFEDFENKLRQGVKLFILCSPHNPVGRVWPREDLLRMVDLCDRYDTLILSDEIHCDLIFSGHRHIPITTISKRAREISIIVTSPSKTFNIAGLKSSMIFVHNPTLREKIKALMKQYHVGVNLFAFKATEVVYRDGDEWVDELLVYLEENARFVYSFICEHMPKVKTYLPDGTYLMWLDFSGYHLNQPELMQRLQDTAGVALNSGEDYGEQGKHFVRLNIGTPRALLQKGLEKIAAAF